MPLVLGWITFAATINPPCKNDDYSLLKYLYAQTHANHNRSCAFDWLVNIACLPK